MAFLGMSDDFDLDDDGILRDSASSTGGFLIDNDGIVRDDLDLYKNTGHWTDSGFGGDKQSSTSTLRQLQTSFDDDSRIFDVDQSVNISELEASKDDLSFDRESVNSFDQDFQDGSRGNTSAGIVSNRSSLEKPQGVQHIEHNQSANKSKGDNSELFTEEYYQQLRDLGVLVDGADLSNTKDSVQEFEQLEAHLSRENIFDDTAQTDTIADFFRKENERQIQEQANRSQDFTNGGENRFRPNSVASEQTLSSHSFPEVSPEEALMLYNVNRAEDSFDNGKFEYGNQRVVDATGLFHRVGDTSGIFHRSGDDDEIFFITSRMGSEAHMPNLSQNVSPAPYSPHSSRPTSRGSVYSSRSQTPYRDDLQQSSTSLTDISRLGFNQSSVIHEEPDSPVKKEEREQLQMRPESVNHQTKSRPSSVASHRSTVSEAPSSRANQSNSSKQLSKARSEESFFEGNKTPRSSNEKMPKRLLPKPVEENQSFRMKSKSTTNISNRHGPIKPTHLSMSDLSRSGVDDGIEGEGDRSQGELTVKLKQEHLKRKQATELVQQLQKDYDSLLSKYAMAELTIDQMRLGAKITLHSDSPTPNQIQTGTLTVAQHPQVIQMGSAAHGVLSNSPAPGVAGHFSPQPDSLSLRDNRTPTSVSESWAAGRSDRGVGGDSRRTSITESEERGFVPQNVGAEKVKNELLQRAGGLNERIDSFNSLLEQRQLTLEEQEEVFENIRTDHEVLRRHYLQAKEDYNVLRRSGASLKDANFDQGKELEGELFRLGMKFDEIHANVETNLKEKSAARQPFQTNRLAESMEDLDEDEEHAVDQLKRKMQGTLAGSDVVPPREDTDFEKKLQRLHDEYNALMDRYRRLKQMAKTPERDKEIDNLVRKLKQICDEAPDMFRLAPELEERWERMQKQESRNTSRGQSPQPESAPPGAYFLSGEEVSRLQRQKQGRSTPDYRSDSQDRHKEPGTRPGAHEGSGSRTKYEKMNGYHGNTSRDSLSSRDRASPSLPDRGRFSPSSHDHQSTIQAGHSRTPTMNDYSPVIRGGPPGSGRPSLNISRDRLSSDGRESLSRRDDPNTSLPRPRRHSHEFRDHKMRKQPGGGSRQSLDDSGISDQEQGALANLPGPGKFKQMTKQRGADDVDSGFIGSVVGSDVTRPLPQQQQQQQQQSLRLRHPGDSGRRNTASVRSGADTSTSDTGRGQSRSTRDSESEHRDSSMQNDSMEVTASFMDDPTETEVSESDRGQKSQKRQGHGNRNVGHHDQTLEGYSGEEDTDATPKPSTRLKLSPKSENKASASPTKPQRKSRSLVSEEEEEITPRATPTRGIQVSRYVSSSDMETPRSIQARLRQTAPPRSGGTRAPPAGRQLDRTEEHAVKGRESVLKSNLQQRTEDRGVGSDRGHESDATRVSSASGSRLRALQDEVERLKERVEQAVETPPQAPLPPPQSQPEYYDPFDDPYGFMRMPRRRANSFSGTNAREWDEWYWTLPNQRRNDGSDIPLGYAAADAYVDVPPPQAAESPARSRIRRRRMERMKKTEQGKKSNPTSGATEHHPFAGPGIVLGAHPGLASQPGVAGHPAAHPGAHPGTHPAAHPGDHLGAHPGLRSGVVPGAMLGTGGGSVGAPSSPREGEDSGLYEYYVPSRYSTQGMRQQLASKGYFRTPSGAKIYASQKPGGPQVPGYHHGHPPPQYAYANYGGGHASRGYQSDTASMHQGANRPFYTIRRSSNRPVFSMPRSRPVMQSYYEDYDSVDGRSGYQTDPGIGAGSGTWRQRSYVVEAVPCPLCGGSGEHSHAEYDEGDNLQYHTREFVTERSSRPHRRSRSASRSVSRSHHFSPERSSSYWIREFRETSSDDTDDEVYSRRRRSRSLSRTRRKTRKYRKVHGSYSDRDVDRDDSLDVDLNESLNLSEDIRGLTRRMLRSVRSDLRSYKRRDFGSSEW